MYIVLGGFLQNNVKITRKKQTQLHKDFDLITYVHHAFFLNMSFENFWCENKVSKPIMRANFQFDQLNGFS